MGSGTTGRNGDRMLTLRGRGEAWGMGRRRDRSARPLLTSRFHNGKKVPKTARRVLRPDSVGGSGRGNKGLKRTRVSGDIPLNNYLYTSDLEPRTTRCERKKEGWLVGGRKGGTRGHSRGGEEGFQSYLFHLKTAGSLSRPKD